MAALDMLKTSADAIAAEKNYRCMSAIGSAALCGCLKDRLPVVVDFVTYVRITASSKEEIGYAGFSLDDKKIVDSTLAARDQCVAIAFPPK